MQTVRIFSNAREEKKEQICAELSQHIRDLENELKEKNFFGGESIGFVDIAAFFIMYWIQVFQEAKQTELITKEKFPIICKYIEKLHELDVVNECLPPKEKHVAFYVALFEARSASKQRAS